MGGRGGPGRGCIGWGRLAALDTVPGDGQVRCITVLIRRWGLPVVHI